MHFNKKGQSTFVYFLTLTPVRIWHIKSELLLIHIMRNYAPYLLQSELQHSLQSEHERSFT